MPAVHVICSGSPENTQKSLSAFTYKPGQVTDLNEFLT